MWLFFFLHVSVSMKTIDKGKITKQIMSGHDTCVQSIRFFVRLGQRLKMVHAPWTPPCSFWVSLRIWIKLSETLSLPRKAAQANTPCASVCPFPVFPVG